jgi:hypothetical protein
MQIYDRSYEGRNVPMISYGTNYGENNAFMEHVESLYHTYLRELLTIRNIMKNNKTVLSLMPQFDDVESEITCLLILDSKPHNIIEFSPCAGWSTLYMLNALQLCGSGGRIESYDIEDKCTENIAKFSELHKQWKFHEGDVLSKFEEFQLDKIDYLFIDSDHSREFALIYSDTLLYPFHQKLKSINKSVIVSVHDVFHYQEPSEEGRVVIEFLKALNLPYFAPSNFKHKVQILNTKKSHGIVDLIHNSWGNVDPFFQSNPSIFFELGPQKYFSPTPSNDK